MPYKCEICGKTVEDGTICCGAAVKNRIPENESFTPDMGR